MRGRLSTVARGKERKRRGEERRGEERRGEERRVEGKRKRKNGSQCQTIYGRSREVLLK
jgi:hypothetical protein